MLNRANHGRTALAVATVAVLANAAFALPGDLDPTFGDAGFAFTEVQPGGSTSRAHGVAVQPDGRIVVGGTTSVAGGSLDDFAVARYDSVGSLDETFGTGGLVVTEFAPAQRDNGEAMVVQPDGKIILVGSVGDAALSFWNLALARYETDGSLDPTFDSDGLQTTVVPGLDSSALAVALQPDGKIVVGGSARPGGGPNLDFLVARYDATGTLDASFGSGGIATISVDPLSDVVRAIAVQADGKIVAVGYAGDAGNWNFALARFDANGTLDASFGSGGTVVHDVGGGADLLYGVALQSDGKIVAVGTGEDSSPGEFVVTRYDTTGVLDPTFDADGLAFSTFSPTTNRANAVTIRHDGVIVAAGTSGNATDGFVVAQYLSDGSLDTSFSGDGWALPVVGSGPSEAESLVLQPDGKIVLAGLATDDGFGFGLVRFEAGLGLCGDGVVDPGEICDDSGASAACDSDCTSPLCGDAQPNPAAGEICDVGSPQPTDCCTALCAFSAPGTACEDGLGCTYADTCDGSGSCLSGGPAPCITGFTKATMLINERIPQRKIVKVKLKKGPLLTKADFGDPSYPGGTSYRLCFWDDLDNYIGDLEVDDAGEVCGNQDCWTERANAWHYRRKEAPNLQRLKLNGGSAGKSSVQYVNAKTSDPIGLTAGLAAAGGAKLQVLSSDATCVEGSVDQIKKQEPDFFKAIRK